MVWGRGGGEELSWISIPNLHVAPITPCQSYSKVKRRINLVNLAKVFVSEQEVGYT